ncbi:MAG: hypothetical protein IJ088_03695 [Clostridia bacterium]|nr:hypothetical protein [Clostridia bacterium]
MKKLLILCLFTLLFSTGFAESLSFQDIMSESMTTEENGFVEKLGDQFTVTIPEDWKTIDKAELEYSHLPVVFAYGKDGTAQTVEAAVLDGQDAEAVTFISTMCYENGWPVELRINGQKWDTWYEKDNVILITPVEGSVYCMICHTRNHDLEDMVRIIHSIKPTNTTISDYGITKSTGSDHVTEEYVRSASIEDIYQFSPYITLKGFLIDWQKNHRDRMEKRVSPEWARNRVPMDVYLSSRFTIGEVVDWEIGEKKELSENEVEYPVVVQTKHPRMSQDMKYQETLIWSGYTAHLRLENTKWYVLPDSLTDGETIKTEIVQFKPDADEDKAKNIMTRFLEKWKENDREGMFKFAPYAWQQEHADDGIMERIFGGRQLVDWTIGNITVEHKLMTVQLNLKLVINGENVDKAYNVRIVVEDIFWRVDIESFLDEGK